MKRKSMLLGLMLALVLAVPVYAVDYDFFGTIPYHNTVLSWQVTTGTATVTVFTSSWDDGGFDPMLAVWDSAGNKIHQQDDGNYTGTTYSNGVPYTHGRWDTYYQLDLGPGTYTLTLATFNNWAWGNNLSDPQFAYANETPIPIAEWYQPFNGYRQNFYAVHFLGATSVHPDVPGVPEPATLLLLGAGLVGVGMLRRRGGR